MASKVLACGDVNGKFPALIKRLNTIVKKSGQFDMLLCVGEFFGEDDEMNQRVVSGDISFPIHTYILGGCCPYTSSLYPADDGCEIASNITYLGKKGILNSPSGLTIAYMSGIEGETSNAMQFNMDDVREMLRPIEAMGEFTGVDILLTSMWPAQVARHSMNQPPKEVEGSELLSRMATGLRPRYHFSGMGVHYERSPYRNHQVVVEKQRHCTRFIGLAAVDNPEKEKWIYAFSVVPLKKMSREDLTAQPPNSSEFPYMNIIEQQVQREKQSIMDRMKAEGKDSNTRFDMEADMNADADIGSRKRRRNEFGGDDSAVEKKAAAPCWFCLSNVDAEKHLVVSVGDACYAAMPKGPLTDDHVLVLSVGHIQSLVAAPDEVRDEVEKYKNAFTLAADKKGKALVCFERNYRTHHLQVQMIPVPKACTKGLRMAFLNHASTHNIELSVISAEDKLSDLVNEGCPYFFAELPDGTRLFTRQMREFPLQFGREVLASSAILDCEEKIDWRGCVLGEEKETELVVALKNTFKQFDFTDDGEDSD